MLTLKQRWSLALRDPWWWAGLTSLAVELYFQNIFTLIAMGIIVIIAAVRAKY